MNLGDFEIYRNKNFSSLCKDIVVNQSEKKNQLDLLVSELRPLIKTVQDAIVIVPLIRDYIEVGVRNDEQLVKLAAVVQRIITRNESEGSSEGNMNLTDAERAELMKQVEEFNKDLNTKTVSEGNVAKNAKDS